MPGHRPWPEVGSSPAENKNLLARGRRPLPAFHDSLLWKPWCPDLGVGQGSRVSLMGGLRADQSLPIRVVGDNQVDNF